MPFPNNLSLIPFGVFLAVSCYSCYTDIRYRKIKNHLLLSGILVGILFSLVAFPHREYVQLFFINVSLSILVAAGFWRLNIWAAGDGKFFIFTAVFVSLFTAGNVFPQVYPRLPVIFVVFINSFISAFCYVLFTAMVMVLMKSPHFFSDPARAKKTLTQAFLKIKDPAFIFLQCKIMLFYAGAFVFFSLGGRFIHRLSWLPRDGNIVMYVGFVLLYSCIRKAVEKINIFYIAGGIALLLLWMQLDIIQLLSRVIKFFVLLGGIRLVINLILQHGQVRTVPLEELETAMLLTQEEVDRLPQGQRPKMRFFSDGLLPEQVCQLRKYFQEQNRQTIQIYNTFPFVPFILSGVVISVMLKGRLLDLLSFLY